MILKAWYIKIIKMRKQITNDFSVINTNQNQFKEIRKNLSVEKNPRYIYTEDDLGEGVLDIGVTSSYTKELHDSLNSQLWTSMLKPYWS